VFVDHDPNWTNRGRAMMMVQFAAILHVNRSGSTYLSRVLSERATSLYVFPECAFLVKLLEQQERGENCRGSDLFSLIRSDRRSDALCLDDSTLRSICEVNSSENIKQLLIDIASERLGFAPKVIILKLGSLIYYHRQVHDALSSLRFIHLVRDPRSVSSSMLLSEIPEKPGFNMARGSILFAARDWRDYVNLVRAIGQTYPVSWIRYEDLAGDCDRVCDALLQSMSLEPSADTRNSAASRYAVSALDGSIHARVFRDFQADRLRAWQAQLSPKSIGLIELTCHKQMLQLGYGASQPPLSRLDRIFAWINHLRAMSEHNLKTVLVYMRRRDRFTALLARARLALRKVREQRSMMSMTTATFTDVDAAMPG
jgi:hypothetical protein